MALLASLQAVAAANPLHIRSLFTNVPERFAIGLEGWSDEGENVGTNRWDFGDGTTATNRVYVSHLWRAPGDYTVTFSAYSGIHVAWLGATQNVHVTAAVPSSVRIVQSASNEVTVSWSGNGALLQSSSLDCPAWLRVADSSPATLRIRPEAQFLQVAAQPSNEDLQAAFTAGFDRCIAWDCSVCQECVATYLLMGTASANAQGLPQAEEALGVGRDLCQSDPCIAETERLVLVYLRYLWEGP
jgi:hypothetical protein